MRLQQRLGNKGGRLIGLTANDNQKVKNKEKCSIEKQQLLDIVTTRDKNCYLLFPCAWQLLCTLVVTRQPVDSRLNKNKAKLGVFVFPRLL